MFNAYARNTDPVTSHQAADRVESKIQRLEQVVLDCLERNRLDGGSGLTSKQIAELTGYEHVSISPRMKPLLDRKVVRKTGEKHKRSIVWAIV